MTDRPNWLPDTLDISEATDETVDLLYMIFDRDFKQTTPHYGERPIVFSPGQSVKGYEVIFWHLITGDYHAPDPEHLEFDRAKRLPWCAPIINHALSSVPLVWDSEQPDGKVRTYIWLKDFDYVVIVQKERVCERGDVARLITAYCVNKDWSRKSLQKKYDRRL